MNTPKAAKAAKVNFSTDKQYAAMDAVFNTDPHDMDSGEPKVLLEIDGLEVFRHDEVTGKTLFQLKGLTHKNRNWPEALEALGYKDLSDRDCDDLADKISAVLFQFDITKVLLERVKAIG